MVPVLEADHGFSRPHLSLVKSYIIESRNVTYCGMIDIRDESKCMLAVFLQASSPVSIFVKSVCPRFFEWQ